MKKDATLLSCLKFKIQMVAFSAPYYTDNSDVNKNGSRMTPCVVSRLLVIARGDRQ
jgi:hypothetical protein